MELTSEKITSVEATPIREQLGDRELAPLALARMFISVDALFSQLRRTVDIGPNERLAVEYLWAFGPMPMSELADRLAVTRAAVTTLVDRLEEVDFVARTSDLHDRRRTIVSLSVSGHERICTAVTPWLEAVRSVTSEIDDDSWYAFGKAIAATHEATIRTTDSLRGVAGVI